MNKIRIRRKRLYIRWYWHWIRMVGFSKISVIFLFVALFCAVYYYFVYCVRLMQSLFMFVFLAYWFYLILFCPIKLFSFWCASLMIVAYTFIHNTHRQNAGQLKSFDFRFHANISNCIKLPLPEYDFILFYSFYLYIFCDLRASAICLCIYLFYKIR